VPGDVVQHALFDDNGTDGDRGHVQGAARAIGLSRGVR
jgi:hypothetical protein